MKYAPTELPPDEDLGPRMRALTEQQRKFVIGWVKNRGRNGAACAKAAGYSDKGLGCKVAASRLIRDQKVIAALKEEAERQLDTLAVVAVMRLGDLVGHEDPKFAQAAIDSVLDRGGFSRRTQQDHHVVHTDNRSTAELEAMVRGWLEAKQPVAQIIDSTAEVVSE